MINPRIHTHTRAPDCVETVSELSLLPNDAAVKHLRTHRSGANCWLDSYRWGAGLAVTGWIRNIGQNVLPSYFKTANISNRSYCHMLLLIAFLAEAFIRHIIMLWIKDTIIIIIRISNNNNALINTYYERRQDFILLFKIPMDTRKDLFEIYRKFRLAPSRRFASRAVR
jgi:hypothetical protein